MDVQPVKISYKRLFKPHQMDADVLQQTIQEEKKLTVAYCDVHVWVRDDRAYKVYAFIEDNMHFATLSEVGTTHYSKKQDWKFGYVQQDGTIWMLFNGHVMTSDRTKAKQAFQGIKKYVESNNLGIPFAYKVP